MDDPGADLRATFEMLSAGETTLSFQDMQMLGQVIGGHGPIGDCSDETLSIAGQSVCAAMERQTLRPHTPASEALLALSIRLSFGAIGRPAHLLNSQLLSTQRREIVDRLSSAISLYETVFGENALTFYYKGGREYWKRNIAEAYSLFNKSRCALGPESVAQLDQIGCRSVRTMDEIVRLAKQEARPGKRLTLGRFAPSPYVVVACVDELYLSRYGDRLYDSLATYEDVKLHLHVATDNAQILETLLHERINYSYEPEPKVAQKIHYYQSMRFLRALEFISIYKQPLVFIDADTYFTGSPKYLFEANTHIHVGLNNNRIAYLPWRKFKAECVYIDAGPRGLRFARCLRNLLLNLYESDSKLKRASRCAGSGA